MAYGRSSLYKGTAIKIDEKLAYDFLKQHVDTVSGVVSVTQTADVHTGSAPDMLYAFQGAYVVVCVFYLSHSHIISQSTKIRKFTKKAVQTDGFLYLSSINYSPASMAPVGQTPWHVPQSRQMLGSML